MSFPALITGCVTLAINTLMVEFWNVVTQSSFMMISHNPNTKTWIMIAKDTFNENVYPDSHVVDNTNFLNHLMVDVRWMCPSCGNIEVIRGFLNPFIGDWDNLLADLKSYID
jgi:hypothetical protein